MSINVLDSSIYNRIAAGEVVERPSSIVKELVENSIDANATNISVEVFSGGIKKIVVSDNGCGINAEDLSLAFLPHATSKITSVDDLDGIATLGFRGEALPSIAAVSRVTMTSKPKEQEFGAKIVIEDGKVLDVAQTGSPNGTYITIEGLFKNIPARAKFLKSERAEEAEISNLMSRFILANPQISFKYSANGQTIFQSAGRDLRTAIYNVYGLETLDNVFEVNYEAKDLSIKGFMGQPHFSKANRTYQTLVVNGRFVINYLISSKIQAIYQNYLMKRQYPFFVLHITVPYDFVDVNVHPNKLEVRFAEQNRLLNAIERMVTSTIERNFLAPEIKSYQSLKKSGLPPIDVRHEDKVEEPQKPSVASFNLFTQKNESFNGSLNEPTIISQAIAAANIPQQVAETSADEIAKVAVNAVQSTIFDSDSIKKVGVAFATYIILESGDNLFLIDQHAAHERILFDKFLSTHNNSKKLTQPLLLPFVFSLNHIEREQFLQRLDDIIEMGFEIEEFGINSFRITAVPLLVSSMDLGKFIDAIKVNTAKTADLFRQNIAKAACKAAVKAGDNLNDDEINELIDSQLKGAALLCPHGRPIIIKISKNEFEKWFNRQV